MNNEGDRYYANVVPFYVLILIKLKRNITFKGKNFLNYIIIYYIYIKTNEKFNAQ